MFFYNAVSGLGNAVYNAAADAASWVIGNQNPVEEVAKDALAANEDDSYSVDTSSLSTDLALVNQWKERVVAKNTECVDVVVRYIEMLSEWTETKAMQDPSQRELLIAEAREEIGCILYLADQEEGISSLASSWINPVDPIESRKNIISEVKNRLNTIVEGISSYHVIPVEIAKVLVTQEGIFNASMIEMLKKAFEGCGKDGFYFNNILNKMACGTFNKQNPLAMQTGLIDMLKAPTADNEQSTAMIRSVFQLDPSIPLTDAHAARLVVACLLSSSPAHTSAENILNRAMRKQESIWLNDLKTLIQDGAIYRQFHGEEVKLPFILDQQDLELSEGAFPLHIALTSALAIISEAEKKEITDKICRCVKHVLSPFKMVNTKKISHEQRSVLTRIHDMVMEQFRSSFQVLYDAKKGHYFISQRSFDPSEKIVGSPILGHDGYRDLTLMVIDRVNKSWDTGEEYSDVVFDKMREFANKPEYIRNSIAGIDPLNKGYEAGKMPKLTPWAMPGRYALSEVLDVYYGRSKVEEDVFEGAILL